MNIETKTCTRCGIEKPFIGFCKDASRADGLNLWCKECAHRSGKTWRSKNKSKRLTAQRKYRDANREKVNATERNRYEKIRGKIQRRKLVWRKNNPDKVKKYRDEWMNKNPGKMRELQRNFQKIRYMTLRGNLEMKIGGAIRRALRHNKAGRTWESLVGYSVWDLQVHLQSKFTDGMTWERFLKGEIHIDHIIPKSRFHYETPEDPEFKICWGLNNLQPLWSHDNQSKHAKTPDEWMQTKAS